MVDTLSYSELASIGNKMIASVNVEDMRIDKINDVFSVRPIHDQWQIIGNSMSGKKSLIVNSKFELVNIIDHGIRGIFILIRYKRYRSVQK